MNRLLDLRLRVQVHCALNVSSLILVGVTTVDDEEVLHCRTKLTSDQRRHGLCADTVKLPMAGSLNRKQVLLTEVPDECEVSDVILSDVCVRGVPP